MPNAPLVSWHGEHARIPLPLRMLGRYFVTGQQMRGPGDNATFFHRATVDYRAKPVLRLSAPIWQRLARRHAAVTMPGLLAVAAIWPQVPLWIVPAYWVALLLAAVAWGTRAAWKAFAHRRFNREWIDPSAKVLANIIGRRYTKAWGRQAVVVPAGWGSGEVADDGPREAAHVFLPEGTVLSRSIKESITQNVGARLGIPAPVQAEWSETTPVRVSLSAAPLPPKEVTWTGLQAAIRDCAEDEVVLGRKNGGHLVALSLSEDSPHFLASGAAGTGKSVLLRVLMVQRLIRGDGMMIFDPKKFSHWRWAGGGKLPRDRVVYAYRDEDLHEGWLAVGEEIRRRIELPEDELASQRRVFVIVEEANIQIKKLQRYWKGQRKEMMLEAKARKDAELDYDVAELDPPAQSPAVVALQESVCMGRELRMHVVVAAQRASANVFGGNGGDIRESFQGGRLIAKWDRKLWKMLVDTLAYIACPSGPRGIWGLARGEEFEIFRVPFLDDSVATRLVLDAPATRGPVLGRQTGNASIDVQDTRSISSAVTLKDALPLLPGQDGPAALSVSGLRTAAGRDGFPRVLDKPDGTPYGRTEARLYDLDSLVSWREDVLSRL